MFDKSTLPDVKVVPEELGEFKIIENVNKGYSYFTLMKSDKQLMVLSTKTLREYKEQYSSYDLAYGDVLMSGWGFGLAPCWISKKSQVRSVTVIEKYPEVIEIFKRNNEIPENVKIIYDDVKTYKTEDKYDCVFLDHLPDHDLSPVFDEIGTIAKNIPNHNVMWIWSLELRYMMDVIGFTNHDLYGAPKSMDNIDLESGWSEYVKRYSAPKIPILDQEKLSVYIKTYFNRLKVTR